MSRKKGHGTKRPPSKRAPTPPATSARARRLPLRLTVGLAAATVLVIAGSLLWRRRGADLPDESFPPPRLASGGVEPTSDDFVGAEACASCHAREYEAWSRSTHGRAGGAPGAVTLLGPFDGRPIRFRDAIVTPARDARGAYRFTVARPDEPPLVLRVDAVVGGGHLAGGGTQELLTHAPDGTMRVLPFDFARDEHAWFCTTNGRLDRGWLPITDTLSLAACADWPPRRVLGDIPQFANCMTCHGSQIVATFDTAAHRYVTRYTSLAINCESCHGPARRHVELARAGRLAASANVGMRPLATLDKDASLGVCFRCHALKEAMRPGYLPGRTFGAYYALKPYLGGEVFFPDGRIRSFAYQEQHLYSDCYVSGGMRCTDCHDPHSQHYRDVDGRELPARDSDRQCTGCHPSKADAAATHTHHRPGSAGSRCVDCHMPYLQEPIVGHAVRYARSDHTIPIPRPAFDRQLGVTSACEQCHRDRTAATLQSVVDAWYGTLKPHPPVVDALMRADSMRDRAEAAEQLLRPDARPDIAALDALDRFVERFLSPDMPTLEPAVVERLERLAERDDRDLAAVALAGLHLARGGDRDVHHFLLGRLRAAGDDEPQLRARWALVLDERADMYRGERRLAAAIAAYRKALTLTPGDPRILLHLGIAYDQADEPDSAASVIRRSIALDPTQPLALVELANAYGRRGDAAGATAALRAAITLDPHQAVAYFYLGSLYLQQRRPAAAVPMLERAVAEDPSLADADFALATAYRALADPQHAATALRHGLAYAPSNAVARRALRELGAAASVRSPRDGAHP